MHQDLDKILITTDELEKIVSDLADKINKDYENEEVLLAIILKGSMIFASDLARKLTIPVSFDFIKASSYGKGTQSTGELNVKLDLESDISGKNVIIVEDIIDSGNTLYKLKGYLNERNPKSLKICTLLDKPDRRETTVTVEYSGTVIPDEFVVGYGLDYAEKYRELPYIGILSRSVYE